MCPAIAGARIRSYSLGGTRPACTSASVPRLIALCRRADAQFAGRGRRQRLLADFRAARLHIPEAARDIFRLAAQHTLPDWTLRRTARNT